MKRFIAAAILLLAAVIGGYWAVFYRGFYLHFGERPSVSVPFRAEGTELLYWDGQNYVPFILRGVDMSAGRPGHYATACDAGEEDYLRWFGAVKEMGANAVRVTNVMTSIMLSTPIIQPTRLRFTCFREPTWRMMWATGPKTLMTGNFWALC